MTKRILINLMVFGPGGGATHVFHLCSALAKQSVEVTLICRYADPTTPLIRNSDQIPIRVVTTPFSTNRKLYRLSTLWAFLVWPFRLGFRPYDVLYTFEMSAFTRFLVKFLRPGGKVLLQRAGELWSPDSPLESSLERILDGLFVETPIQAEAAKAVLKTDIPITAMPNIGHCFQSGSVVAKTSESFRMAFLGRYHRDKGIYRFLTILPQLRTTNVELNCYGWGPEFENFKQLVNDLGINDRIQLHGRYESAEELTAILDRTDLVVLPSETEGLPVVLLEAMAHGVPFVATDVGATRALAEENPDVRVVPLDDGALRDAIDEMASKIISGAVSPKRLQDYYESRYGYEKLCARWTDKLLYPETWVEPLTYSRRELSSRFHTAQ